jgi:hypothetical protein
MSDIQALQKENERLVKLLVAATSNHENYARKYYLELSKVEDLQVVNATQAKRIVELEEMIKNSEVK